MLGGKCVMQVISFMAIKGGVGKTTMAFQFAKFLQTQDQKVLMIDLDAQKSLTGTFENEHFNFSGKPTIADVLEKPSSGLIETQVQDNIAIIPSTSNLEEVADRLVSKPNRELLLFMWFVKNAQELNQKYDYIIIDLPPAWNLLSKNGVAVADKIISPMEPSRFGYESHIKVLQSVGTLQDEVVDPVSGKSYITANVFFLGNRIKHNTNSSHEFLSALKHIDNVIGVIPEKELVNASMLAKEGILEYATQNDKLHEQEPFLKLLSDVFSEIQKRGND
jgi:chromosome partitioning protein